MMYCRNCGKQIDDSSNFCPHCGFATNEATPNTASQNATNNEQRRQMMYCKNCGKEINDNADMCIHCGVAVNRSQSTSKDVPYSGYSIAGMVVSIVGLFLGLFGLVPAFGIIFSCLAMKQTANKQMKGRGMAITGLVLGIIGAVYILLYLTVLANIINYGY